MNGIIMQGMGEDQSLLTRGYGETLEEIIVIPPVIQTGPSGGGGGSSKSVNPTLPSSRRPTVQWQQSQWYHTTFKVPLIVTTEYTNRINTSVATWQDESYKIGMPVTISDNRDLPVNQTIEFSELFNSKLKTSATYNNDLQHTLYGGVEHNNDVTGKLSHGVIHANKYNKNTKTPVIHKEEVDKKVIGKIVNLKLMDIIDLL